MSEAQNTQLSRGSQSRLILNGKHSYGIHNIKLKSWGEGANLYVGSFCSIAGDLTVFLGGNHNTRWGTTFPFGHIHQTVFPSGEVYGGQHPFSNGHVVIGNDVWIGQGCTIMSGVEIGDGCVIAAKSVVCKSSPPYSIIGGNPAGLIRKRFEDDIISEMIRVRWWEYDDDKINRVVPLLQQPLTRAVLIKIREELNS